MSAKIAQVGPGQFQWSTGGWFGAQLGGTAWMLIGGIFCLFEAPWVGLIWLGLFAVVNLICTRMWSRRDQLAPYPAMRLLIILMGVSGFLALLSFSALAPATTALEIKLANGRIQRTPTSSLRSGYIFFLVLIPTWLLLSHLLEQAALKAKHRSQASI